jgi:hypothetical protein
MQRFSLLVPFPTKVGEVEFLVPALLQQAAVSHPSSWPPRPESPPSVRLHFSLDAQRDTSKQLIIEPYQLEQGFLPIGVFHRLCAGALGSVHPTTRLLLKLCLSGACGLSRAYQLDASLKLDPSASIPPSPSTASLLSGPHPTLQVNLASNVAPPALYREHAFVTFGSDELVALHYVAAESSIVAELYSGGKEGSGGQIVDRLRVLLAQAFVAARMLYTQHTRKRCAFAPLTSGI